MIITHKISPKEKRKLYQKILKHYRVEHKAHRDCLKQNEVNFSRLARDTGIKSHATLTRAFKQGKSLTENIANKLENHFNNLDKGVYG